MQYLEDHFQTETTTKKRGKEAVGMSIKKNRKAKMINEEAE
jgi:hypothetical protein